MRRGGSDSRRRRTGGFALIAAIFILVVLSATAALSLRLVGRRQAASSLGLLSTRAFYAARSGIEWGMGRVAAGDACPAASIALAGGALEGFTVQVDCQSSSHVEGSSSHEIIRLMATASRGTWGDRDYVSRRVETVLTP